MVWVVQPVVGSGKTTWTSVLVDWIRMRKSDTSPISVFEINSQASPQLASLGAGGLSPLVSPHSFVSITPDSDLRPFVLDQVVDHLLAESMFPDVSIVDGPSDPAQDLFEPGYVRSLHRLLEPRGVRLTVVVIVDESPRSATYAESVFSAVGVWASVVVVRNEKEAVRLPWDKLLKSNPSAFPEIVELRLPGLTSDVRSLMDGSSIGRCLTLREIAQQTFDLFAQKRAESVWTDISAQLDRHAELFLADPS